MTGAKPPREPEHPSEGPRRGRPPGSVSLTPEIAERILELIRGGTWDYVAAEAAGISDRTFYEWIQRGEGEHPTRPRTRKLQRFAEGVRRAKAEARAAGEIRLFRENPGRWLSYVARTKPGREGWTHPPETERAADPGHELEALIRGLEAQERDELRPEDRPWDGASADPADPTDPEEEPR